MDRREETSEQPRSRSDARRNRERVYQAALEVLAERGSSATILDIARHAGVGKATVYRNFPTKSAILDFAVEHHGQWLAERIEQAIHDNDGWPGFESLVRDTMLRIRTEPILLEALRLSNQSTAEIVGVINERLLYLMNALRTQGYLRSDATIEDLAMLVVGTSDYLASRSATADECQRAAELIANALRRHSPV
ncbi:TetR/AcrR family transcriptional regulator [Alicyclobacillus acidiphilus]|uniref:TetR/AcrR family transcriptional regulator n=1 Tax=Alicyclobacillus acidiphilus TaxID=182455 RepID=UPI00082C0476|nr:TetR/AcrR family transcriptional regulator [Alicyclobacillus acidiphilus]